MKTWKKIEETKRRATEVIRLKQKNEERVHQKLSIAKQEQMRQQEQKQRLLRMRAERQNEKQKIADAVFLHKKEEAKQQKFLNAQGKQR